MKDKGFTLIEMMVSVSIFALVMLVSTGALLSILDANRKSQSQATSFTNLNFALESMSRGIRVGTTYRCIQGTYSQTGIDQPHDCSTGGEAFAFESYSGSSANPNDQIVYRLNNNQIERSAQGGSSNSFVPVTSPEIVVEGLEFYVRGSAAGNNTQPGVLITAWGYAGTTTKTRADFNLETFISQRLLDI